MPTEKLLSSPLVDEAEKAWFAVRTKPNHEKVTAKTLESLGHEPFLPLGIQRRKWSDRVKTAEFPLFPGYLFCRFAWERRLPILTTPGVTSIVSFGGKPAPVDPEEISSLQKVTDSGMLLEPQTFLAVG